MIIKNNLDVLVIVGPTAVGKTELAIKLAKKYNGEIISGDAYQVYKKMDIGTAKASEAEMGGVPHHLIDIIDYKEEYSVKIFQKEARKKIEEIKARGKLPIIAGGTGLYVQAVLFDYKFEEIEGFAEQKARNEKKANIELQEYIKSQNVSLNNSDFNNHKRLVMIATKLELGLPIQSEGKNKYYKNIQIIGLTANREHLYDKINMRVDLMFENGLIDEVKQFEPNYISQAGIGYKEVHSYLQGEITLEQAKELVKKNTRNFAKRQFTWYNNKMELEWYIRKGEEWQLLKN